MKKTKIEPILKWAGGKRQLLGEINKYLPQNITTYVEPFIGGGALLFDLQPKKAIINDLNEELINVYEVIRDFPDELIEIPIDDAANPQHRTKIIQGFVFCLFIVAPPV